MRLLTFFGLVVAFLAAGCSAQTGSSQQKATLVGEPLALAAERAREAGTSRVAFTGEMKFEGMSRPASFDGEGVFDYKRCWGQVSWDFADLLRVAGAEVEGNAAVAELRFFDEVLFARMPFLSEGVPGAKPWIEFSLAESDDLDSASDDLMSAIGGDDPSTALNFIRGASGEVKNEGSDEIRGVDTTHYSAEVDLAKAVELAPKRDRPRLRRSLERLREADVETVVPVEVWIDAEGLARRIRQTYPVVNDETLEMTLDLFDFGTPVDIKRPAPDQTMTEKEFDALTEAWE
jgi:hypothetical protein